MGTSGEIRQNKITRQWVIFAPARGKRPHDFKQPESGREQMPEYDAHCPFCPGNEHMLPSIIMEVSEGNSRWRTRIVPNKYPALTPSGDSHRFSKGLYLAMHGYGRHEVIIESPQHNRQIALMENTEVAIVIETYHRRYHDLMQERESQMVILFRNHGTGAGTSLFHPHSQVIVTGMVPNHIRWREDAAQRYYDELGRCVYCDMLENELHDQQRSIFENRYFVAFVPYAAEVPFEVWVMPKNHQADFGDISDEEKNDLAAALHDILGRLYTKLNDPDYNYIINTSARYRANEPQLHWYLQIRPRLTTPAGFEIGSGISINPSFPEEDAAFLKES